jgi:hypothetical protein
MQMERDNGNKTPNTVHQIVIEWSYEPKDYFESRIILKHDRIEIVIDSGHIEARLGPEYFDNIDKRILELNENLKSRFLAVQVVTHLPYNLSNPSRYDLWKDGTKNIYVHSESLRSSVSLGTVDIVSRDAAGNVISDTRQERIDKKKWFAETAVKFRVKDTVLDQMLKSYDAAVSDPKNELIYLYEIRDSAIAIFKNSLNAKKQLNITNAEWNLLGLLANRKPLEQGRHRGENPGSLRKAEGNELEQARKIAAKIIESYLIYLEQKKDCST